MTESAAWSSLLWTFKRKRKTVTLNPTNLFDILSLNHATLLFLWVTYATYIGCTVELCEIINYHLNAKYKIYM